MSKKAPETNPFVQIHAGFRINAVWKTEELSLAGTFTYDNSNGKGSTQLRAYQLEKDERVSIYTDGMLSFFPSLSSSAKDMIMYIATRIQFGVDVIEIDEDKYCGTMGISHTTFYKAKKELVNRIIIPRTSRRNTYWINPSYLFKGNRMLKYPEAVRMVNDHPFDKLKLTPDSMIGEPDPDYTPAPDD